MTFDVRGCPRRDRAVRRLLPIVNPLGTTPIFVSSRRISRARAAVFSPEPSHGLLFRFLPRPCGRRPPLTSRWPSVQVQLRRDHTRRPNAGICSASAWAAS